MAAQGTMANKVMFQRRRRGSGREKNGWIQAAAARIIANPIWIHSEVRIHLLRALEVFKEMVTVPVTSFVWSEASPDEGIRLRAKR
jgi:hypothetical protein